MRHCVVIFLLCGFGLAGCEKHPMADYRPLDQAGMGSSSFEQLKTLNTSDAEIAQVVRLKQGGISDDTCVALVRAAHAHQHIFNSTDAAVSLGKAGFTEPQILEFAQTDQVDMISGEAVTLKLIGLSDPTVQALLQRRLQGQATLASAQISRLKNTGLSEQQIVERINQGMTDEQAEKEIKARESKRNHAHTDFVRNGRRRSR